MPRIIRREDGTVDRIYNLRVCISESDYNLLRREAQMMEWRIGDELLSRFWEGMEDLKARESTLLD